MGTPEMDPDITPEMDPEIHTLRTSLFKSVMRGDWEDVVATYNENPKCYNAQITRSGDTSIHLAVRDGKDEIVEELVNIMRRRDPEAAVEALKTGNDRKTTALHLAAAFGSVPMCKSIAEIDPSLIVVRNDEGETPLFWAALYGKKDTFSCLHYMCGENYRNLSYFRRSSDGDTILHVAIAGEYFDIAFQIIQLYKELAGTYNEKGMSPLHVLASKPNAFKSSTNLEIFQHFIYRCIIVEKLEPEDLRDKSRSVTASNNTNISHTYPRNCETCMNFLYYGRKVFEFVISARNLLSEGMRFRAGNKNLTKNQQRDTEKNQQENLSKDHGEAAIDSSRLPFPPTYITPYNILKFVSKAMLVVLGLGSTYVKDLESKKRKHTWSVQIMDELLNLVVMYEYAHSGKSPSPSGINTDGVHMAPPEAHDEPAETKPNTIPEAEGQRVVKKEAKLFPEEVEGKTVWKLVENYTVTDKMTEKPKATGMAVKETAILMAAKNGIKEMVEKILEKFPVAIHDENSDNKKNIALLAVENRQPHVYQFLLDRTVLKDSILRKVDDKGNSALHLAATLGHAKPWHIPGAALQMQWEIKWFKFVKNSMPHHFFYHHNNDNKTAEDIFTETHKNLVRSGGEWLMKTSESCSVVAALIATVAFATAAAVPGGVNDENGKPTLEKHPAFSVFAISSLVALCFSVTAVVMFLSILTSRNEVKDFGEGLFGLPNKLLFGLTSLFVSIAAILMSFCAGHFFVLRDELKYAAIPIYAVTCVPVTIFAIAQFPLYLDLVWALTSHVPHRRYVSSL